MTGAGATVSVIHAVGITIYTIVILGIGAYMMRHRPGGELVAAGFFAWLVCHAAMSNGIPFWRNQPFGDAYDLTAVAFLALCWARSA